MFGKCGIDKVEVQCYYSSNNNKIKIEVAYFMSNSFDVTGTDEEEGKGKTPKEEMTCKSSLGHAVKNCMTVIYIFRWGAIRL